MDVLAAPFYRIPPGAEQRATWAILKASGASAATTLSAAPQNTQQLPFIVDQLCVHLVGGAAQYPTHCWLEVQDPEQGTFYRIGGTEFAGTVAASTKVFGMHVSLIMPRRYFVAGFGIFNAAANVNTVNVYAHGWFIPQGTLGMP